MNASALPPPLPPLPRSPFVNVLAWIALCLCGVGLVLLVVEVLAFNAFSHTEAFALLRQHVMAKPEAAALLATLSRWLPGLLVLSVVRSSLTMIAAIGLLKRREWARRLFVGLLAFAAVWQCVTIAMQWWFTGAMQTLLLAFADLSKQSEQMRMQFGASMSASHITGAIFGLAFLGLYVWLARQLCTPRIRAEFATGHAARDAVSL